MFLNKTKEEDKIIKKPQTKVNCVVHLSLAVIITLVVVFVGHIMLQLGQNNNQFHLVFKFIFLWHTEKFLIGSLVLLALDVFLISLMGSVLYGNIIYIIIMASMSAATFQKMKFREEPIYPDDLKMLTQFQMFRDILGTGRFVLLCLLLMILCLFVIWKITKSLKLSKKIQIFRIVSGLLSLSCLIYASNFNTPTNLLRKGYDRSALWIPYSQKMNYYNVGFVGGFLFNTRVQAMEEPKGYSKESIEKIVSNYNKRAEKNNQSKSDSEKPNVVYIMSESFSDPNRLEGIDVTPNPLKEYSDVARSASLSGQMLSSGYGGGTANIEFEALTGFSMDLMSAQMTTPYTMLLPKQKSFPSIVSSLKQQGYYTMAIHPYNTSMYKRQENYTLFGFDEFKSEKTMTHKKKIVNDKNNFISDQSAFSEVYDQLKKENQPQFIHLVTMQTHMPYNTKYVESHYYSSVGEGQDSLVNYAQDIAYASEALKSFMSDINNLSRPTIVVFWGDHLPSIYSEEVVKKNTKERLHLTEFFVSNPKVEKEAPVQAISPIYFQQFINKNTAVEATGFSMLLQDMYQFLPAFEKQSYYYQNDWHKELKLLPENQKVFDQYRLIQYDIVSGNKYSKNLFEVLSR
ncbi:hypothetical protein CBF37_06950 [Vagococcus vulneris]|uniref:Sulfatase N-terminal domain-containing protein n=2 Tax=Vagococcus vulneris TaxID=1977869 RepID=A0A429ZY30_9ENTE|nr:hypothetical protein CBF37_06950 [Vagococcus vulneris]